jgi:hypothetical protein
MPVSQCLSDGSVMIDADGNLVAIFYRSSDCADLVCAVNEYLCLTNRLGNEAEQRRNIEAMGN